MKTSLSNRRSITVCSTALLPLAATLLALPASAQSTFEFLSSSNLNDSGIGATLVGPIDPTTGITPSLVTVDILGYGDAAGATITRESANPGSHITNVSSSALSVNSGDGPDTGSNSENNNFNPGEGWEFSFDSEVELAQITFESWDNDAPAEMTLSSTAFAADIIIQTADLSGDDAFTFTTPVAVPANTAILLQMTSDDTAGNETGVRLEFLTVNTVPPVSTGNDLDWIGGTVGNWNSSESNFSDMGTTTTFTTDDHVTISSAAAITVDAGGITAGDITVDQADPDLITLTGGNLTSESLNSSGTGTFQIGNIVNTGITELSSGELELLSNGSLTTNAITLSGGANLTANSNSSLTINNTSFLDDGGGSITNDADIEFNNLVNEILANPLDKSGSGTLTFSDGIGTQTSGPVSLNIFDGAVRVSNSGQINIGGDGPANEDPISNIMAINGQLLLDGPIVMIHNSQIVGTGSIVVESPSALESRFNIGPVQIEVPITLNSDLNIDAPTNDSVMTIAGVISGAADLNKIGNGNIILTGANTYLGDTTIDSGNLRLDNPFLSDDHSVVIDRNEDGNGNNRSVLNLAHGQGDVVDTLFIDGRAMPPGNYGGTDVDPSVTLAIAPSDQEYFSGTGYLTVTNGPALSDYALWAQGFGLTGGFDDDDDGDGLSNGAEYTFGLIPNDSSSNCPLSPIDSATGVFTYTRRDILLTELIFAVDYNTTLDSNDWIDFTADATIVSDGQSPLETITVTIPPAILANDKLFVRVVGFE